MSQTEPTSALAKYADIFERTVNPIFLLDADEFLILEANEAGASFLRTTSASLPGQDLSTWISVEKKEEWQKGLRLSKRRYYPTTVPLWWILRDTSTRITNASFCQIGLTDGRSVVQVVLEDITEKFQAESSSSQAQSHIAEIRAQLEQLEAIL
jgi:PAS domain-containing protein